MIPKCVPPVKSMGFSEFFLDFLADKPSPRSLFEVHSTHDVANHLDGREYDRKWLSEILLRQNRAFGAADPALESIGTFAKDRRSLCVFTGQQAVLFGGPMLVVHKVIGIIKAARSLSEKLERHVIPIFWIAADDHDLDEVNHTYLLDRSTRPVELAYGAKPQHEIPVSDIVLSDAEELSRVMVELTETLGPTDFTDDLYETLQSSYTSDDTFVTAFGKLMARLFSGFGLVMFSPADPDVKLRAVPFFKAVLERQDLLHERLDAANSRILGAGYRLQVEKSAEAAHLFCNQDGRRPLHRDGKHFLSGGEPTEEVHLSTVLKNGPQALSPDVLTRPIMQSWLFPVVQQIGGPAELAYYAQLQPLFELFDCVPPMVAARPSVTVIEARIARLAHDYHIDFAELTGDIEQVVNRVLAHSLPGDLERALRLLQDDVDFHLREFSDEAIDFDPGFKKYTEQTFGKIEYLLKGVEGKAFAAHKKKSGEKRERIYRVQNALFTNRGLQERSLNITYFLARYGPDFLSYLYERIDGEERAHQIIDMTEYHTK